MKNKGITIIEILVIIAFISMIAGLILNGIREVKKPQKFSIREIVVLKIDHTYKGIIIDSTFEDKEAMYFVKWNKFGWTDFKTTWNHEYELERIENVIITGGTDSTGTTSTDR